MIDNECMQKSSKARIKLLQIIKSRENRKAGGILYKFCPILHDMEWYGNVLLIILGHTTYRFGQHRQHHHAVRRYSTEPSLTEWENKGIQWKKWQCEIAEIETVVEEVRQNKVRYCILFSQDRKWRCGKAWLRVRYTSKSSNSQESIILLANWLSCKKRLKSWRRSPAAHQQISQENDSAVKIAWKRTCRVNTASSAAKMIIVLAIVQTSSRQTVRGCWRETSSILWNNKVSSMQQLYRRSSQTQNVRGLWECTILRQDLSKAMLDEPHGFV